MHVYNSTNPVQREQVFRLDREGIKAIAVRGAEWVKAGAAAHPETEWTFQYSPESFSDTELDFAVEVCAAAPALTHSAPRTAMAFIPSRSRRKTCSRCTGLVEL